MHNTNMSWKYCDATQTSHSRRESLSTRARACVPVSNKAAPEASDFGGSKRECHVSVPTARPSVGLDVHMLPIVCCVCCLVMRCP